MEKFALCDQAYYAVRSNPDDRAEMVSQILFGELFEIVEQNGNWLKVILLFDQYQGWIFLRQPFYVTEEYVSSYNNESPVYTSRFFQRVVGDYRQLELGIGSRLPLVDGHFFKMGSENFWISNSPFLFDKNISECALTNIVNCLLETPYFWGGRSSFGIDCSGLVQLIMKYRGVIMPRDASSQFKMGKEIGIGQVQIFDLAFFGDSAETVTHTGILLNKDEIIHASGKVRKDIFDSHGILNAGTGEYTHKLIGIKRVLNK